MKSQRRRPPRIGHGFAFAACVGCGVWFHAFPGNVVGQTPPTAELPAAVKTILDEGWKAGGKGLPAAEAAYNKASPKDYRGPYAMGLAYLRQRTEEPAAAHFREALARDRTQLAAWHGLIWAELQRGNTVGAAQAIGEFADCDCWASLDDRFSHRKFFEFLGIASAYLRIRPGEHTLHLGESERRLAGALPPIGLRFVTQARRTVLQEHLESRRKAAESTAYLSAENRVIGPALEDLKADLERSRKINTADLSTIQSNLTDQQTYRAGKMSAVASNNSFIRSLQSQMQDENANTSILQQRINSLNAQNNALGLEIQEANKQIAISTTKLNLVNSWMRIAESRYAAECVKLQKAFDELRNLGGTGSSPTIGAFREFTDFPVDGERSRLLKAAE